MKIIASTLLAAMVATAIARPQGYSAPSRGSGGGFFSSGSSGGGFVSGGSSGGGFVSGGFGGGGFGGGALSLGGDCPEGEAKKADGSCAKAQITRNIYLYAAPPAQEIRVGAAARLPEPKVHYNFVFVRTPEIIGGSRPVVVPPPQQKTLVYVLTRRPGVLDQEVIEVPSTPTQPEVFFVNYEQGDNPQLPGGIDLQEALRQSAQQGQVIDGGVGAGVVGGGFAGAAAGGFVSGGSSGAGFVSGGAVGGAGFVSSGGSGGGFGGGSLPTQYTSPQ